MKDTKQHIAESAFQLFVQQGFRATSMAQLVAASGLSKGAVYHHFQSKQAIYDFVIEAYFLRFFREVEWKKLEDLEPEAFIISMHEYYKSFLQEVVKLTRGIPGKYFVLFFEAHQFVPGFAGEIQAFYKRYRTLLSHCFQDIPKEKAKQKAIGKIAQLEGMVFWQAIFPNEDATQWIDPAM